MKWTKVNGVVAATFTPMNQDGSLNSSAIPSYIQHLLNLGVKDVFVNGTTGEMTLLTVEERKAVAEAWVKHGKGKLGRIIVHCGGGNLAESQELVKHAAGIGADCVAVVGPTYFKPRNVVEVVEYLAEIAKEAPDTPFLYYHIPSMTAIDISITNFFMEAHGKIPTLVGVKFTSPDLHDATSASVLFDGKYDVIMGTDGTVLAALAMGLRGVIAISANIVGKADNRLIKAFDEGKIEVARNEQIQILKILNEAHKVGDTNDYIASMKALVPEYFPSVKLGPPRKPLSSIPNDRIEAIKAKLASLRIGDVIN